MHDHDHATCTVGVAGGDRPGSLGSGWGQIMRLIARSARSVPRCPPTSSVMVSVGVHGDPPPGGAIVEQNDKQGPTVSKYRGEAWRLAAQS